MAPPADWCYCWSDLLSADQPGVDYVSIIYDHSSYDEQNYAWLGSNKKRALQVTLSLFCNY